MGKLTTKRAGKSIPNYDVKMSYLIEHQRGHCPIKKANGKLSELWRSAKVDLDHSRIHNTEINRAKYPLFIHSLLNLRAVDHKAHLSLPRSQVKIKGEYRAKKIEHFLERHPRIAKWVNCPSYRLFY